MTRLRRIPLVLIGTLSLAAAAAAAPQPSELAASTNYTHAKRSARQVRFVVIHVTEGTYVGSVAWLRDPRAHASVNFVVSREGRVSELVPLHDIAWHAGNWAYNLRSVGIENAGYVDDPAGFPMREYKATARLAATIARRSLIPIDRRHIIGHSEVPDPNDPLQGGGIDGHTDPGPYWKWGLFMKLVRDDAFPERALKRRHVGLQVESSTLYGGQLIAGSVPWRAKIAGPVNHVSFVVDGKVRWVDHVAPFAFSGGKPWSTLGLRNGKHTLELRAYGPKGSWMRHAFKLRVKNEPFTLATVGLKPKQTVVGKLQVEALFTGMPPARVRLVLDGREIDHDTSPPYVFHWDTRRAQDGAHTLALVARARDGRIVRTTIPLRVANAGVLPPSIASDSLADGQTVSGLQHWLVDTGGSVSRVEFVVDGKVRATVSVAPYAWDWDTAQETSGTHVLTVRALGVDGTAAEQSLSVTVQGPSAP
jgi:N-acetyl-anhydromuramyl-L-alanine amidase AmpD